MRKRRRRSGIFRSSALPRRGSGASLLGSIAPLVGSLVVIACSIAAGWWIVFAAPPRITTNDKVGLFFCWGIAVAFCSPFVFPRSEVALRVSGWTGFLFLGFFGVFALVCATLILFSSAPLWALPMGLAGVGFLVACAGGTTWRH